MRIDTIMIFEKGRHRPVAEWLWYCVLYMSGIVKIGMAGTEDGIAGGS